MKKLEARDEGEENRIELEERVKAPLFKFASQALDQYLADHPEVTAKLFPPEEGRASERLKERAAQAVSEKVGIFMARNEHQLGQILENSETHKEGQELVKNIAYEIAEAACHALGLESKINIDSLTGLPNYGAYKERLKEEIARSDRSGHSFCLVILDLDKFKMINDTHGHQAGDDVLVELTNRLRSEKIMRASDFFSRYAGDEFVFILPDTNAGDACIAAFRISEAIESEPFMIGKNGSSQPIDVTGTIGVAEFEGKSKDPDGQRLFEEADDNLYTAKDSASSVACNGQIIDIKEIKEVLEARNASTILFPIQQIRQRRDEALEVVQ